MSIARRTAFLAIASCSLLCEIWQLHASYTVAEFWYLEVLFAGMATTNLQHEQRVFVPVRMFCVTVCASSCCLQLRWLCKIAAGMVSMAMATYCGSLINNYYVEGL